MKKPLKYLAILSIVLVSFTLINATTFIKQGSIDEPSNDTIKNTSEKYEIKALKIPEGIHFAGELLPLDIPDINERMDRELLVNTYWQSNSLLLIKRANKYFPIIEPILKEAKNLAAIDTGKDNEKT